MAPKFTTAIATAVTALLAQGSLQNDLGYTTNEYLSDLLGESERQTEILERIADTLEEIHINLVSIDVNTSKENDNGNRN